MGRARCQLLLMLMLLLCPGSVISVIVTTNYAGIKPAPCSHEPICVTCSVVGTSLRWTIDRTSLQLTGSNTRVFVANEANIGSFQSIPTSTIDFQFYQTATIQNMIDPSKSTIESQMLFHLLPDEFVDVSCTDSALETRVESIKTLGTPAPPSDFRKTDRSIIGPKNCSHEIGWSMENTSGLKGYSLMRCTNGTCNVTERQIHPEENLTSYSLELTESVTLAIMAINQCNMESNMSDLLILSRDDLLIATEADEEEDHFGTGEIGAIGAAVFVALLFFILFVISTSCVAYVYYLKEVHFKLKEQEIDFKVPEQNPPWCGKGAVSIESEGLEQEPVASIVMKNSKDRTQFQLVMRDTNVSHCIKTWRAKAPGKRMMHLYCKLDEDNG